MRINADFNQRAIVTASADRWVPSPVPGVDRLMLDRIGDEKARATSVVRYAPNSRFDRHTHDLGEEFLVLDGVFSDEHRDYPTGTYVRNPPGTAHSPWSESGCRILVKLRQFDTQDLVPVVVDSTDPALWIDDPGTDGQRLDLYQFGSECVALLRIPAGVTLFRTVGEGGLEWFLVQGSLSLDDTRMNGESWARLPAGDKVRVHTLSDCLVWQKTGHLPSLA